MSEEKTEQPTPKKKQDSRKKGQTLQSKELTTFSAIITVVAYFFINYKSIIDAVGNIYNIIFNFARYNLEPFALFAEAWNVVFMVGVLPVLYAAVFSAVINVIQMGGIVIAAEALQWKFDKFNLVNNFKNIFSKKNWIKFFKSIAEVYIMTYVGWIIVEGFMPDILKVARGSVLLGIALFMTIAQKVIFILLLLYFIFAAIEFLIEMVTLHKQLMMTLEEVKNEHKSSEGNQEIKHARKEFHREIMEDGGGGFEGMDATFVLANPTHVAILMYYSPKKYITPIVLHKASGYAATILFRFARRKNIPIIRSPWLARQLLALAEIRKPIPPSLSLYLVEVFRKNIKLFPNVVKELQEVMAQQAKRAENSKVDAVARI